MSLAFWLRRCRCRSQRGKGMGCSKGKEGGRSIESGCRLYSVLHVVVAVVVVAAESKLRAARLHSRRQVTPPVPVAVAVAVRVPHVPHLLRAKPITYKIHELTSWQRATCNSNSNSSGGSSSRRRQATTTHIHLQANAPQPPTSDNNNSNSNANRRRLSRLPCPLSPPFPTLSLSLCLPLLLVLCDAVLFEAALHEVRAAAVASVAAKSTPIVWQQSPFSSQLLLLQVASCCCNWLLRVRI